MKKRLLAVLIAICMTFSYTAFAAQEDSGKVEIKFRVGDSVLSINGNDVEVETPYIAGDGTTLVPLRVITEAFGAQVDWEGTTQTITLSYPEVNIVLQIGSSVAKVNDHAETMLEPPALSSNGVTMVPLRFISETFGADVGYDNATGGITVTKGSVTGSQTVTGITNMTRTGDSYYKWSIDTPTDMDMTDRSLDGMSTEFTADDESKLYVDVYQHTEDNITPFDEEFSRIKDSLSKYTLMEAEKLTDSAGNRYMHFQAKDTKDIVDIREYYANDNITYKIVSFINISDDTSTKDMILSIADSFKLGSIGNDTYDLSNVADGMREVKSEEYKLSFKVPANYMQYSSDIGNEFIFVDPDSSKNSSVHLGVFSKTESVTAQKLAQHDHDSRLKAYNSSLSKVSDVVNMGDNRYSYTQTISGSSKSDGYNIDMFFEKGDYVYNMSVMLDSEKKAADAEKLIDSLKTEELDSAKTGKLLRNDPDDETIVSNTVGNYKLPLPASWKSVFGSISGTHAYANSSTGSMITVMIDNDSSYTAGRLSEEANSYYKYIKNETGNKTIDTVTYENIGDNRFAHFTYKISKDGYGDSYVTVYIMIKSKELILFQLYDEDIFYGGESQQVLKNALEAFEAK